MSVKYPIYKDKTLCRTYDSQVGLESDHSRVTGDGEREERHSKTCHRNQPRREGRVNAVKTRGSKEERMHVVVSAM